ncbi:MAG: cofactor-independent phosphoglycerate mutase [Bacillota bacterium]|nr:cofactor-independent phosphoglycerate mutase [Bacillota bacterium]
MKHLLLLTDGMADYKIPLLGNKTPLQYAKTPNMDAIAPHSKVGMVHTIPEGYPPGSDVANMSVMGYAPQNYYTGRSPLEAVSLGVDLGSADLALRCNLVTLSEEKDYSEKTMLDYSAGEISTEESAQLVAALQAELNSNLFAFHPGISYRHLTVWKDAMGKTPVLTPPHDISDRKIKDYLPSGDDANHILDLMQRSEKILRNHPINIAREEKGLHPATSIWLWGEGSRPSLDAFNDKYDLDGAVVCAVDLVRGLGICAGLTPVSVEGGTGAVKTNFAGKAKAAIDQLKQGKDFVYLHIESPDEAGHQGEPQTKVWSIEQIDQEVLGYILTEMASFDDFRLMILPDHPTPLSLKTHTSEPVPFMIYDKNHPEEGPTQYNEETAANGPFISSGPELLRKFLSGKW